MTTPIPQPQTAQIYDAHEYVADPNWAPHTPDHAPAPCVCGSAESAYIHHVEARTAGATVMVRSLSAGDSGEGGDGGSVASFENGGNGSAIVVPGRDTREGTDAYTQEPGTQRVSVDEPLPEPVVEEPTPTPVPVAQPPATPAASTDF